MKMGWNFESIEKYGGMLNPSPAQVFDANGLEWRAVTWCDTETGEMERHLLDENGKHQFDGNDFIKEFHKVAAPIVVIPKYVGG